MKKDTQDIVMYNIFTNIKKIYTYSLKKIIQKIRKKIRKNPFIARIFA